jgi:hypothetical protein
MDATSMGLSIWELAPGQGRCAALYRRVGRTNAVLPCRFRSQRTASASLRDGLGTSARAGPTPGRRGDAGPPQSALDAPMDSVGYAVSVACAPRVTAPRAVATNAVSAWSSGTRPARSSALAA